MVSGDSREDGKVYSSVEEMRAAFSNYMFSKQEINGSMRYYGHIGNRFVVFLERDDGKLERRAVGIKER